VSLAEASILAESAAPLRQDFVPFREPSKMEPRGAHRVCSPSRDLWPPIFPRTEPGFPRDNGREAPFVRSFQLGAQDIESAEAQHRRLGVAASLTFPRSGYPYAFPEIVALPARRARAALGRIDVGAPSKSPQRSAEIRRWRFHDLELLPDHVPLLTGSVNWTRHRSRAKSGEPVNWRARAKAAVTSIFAAPTVIWPLRTDRWRRVFQAGLELVPKGFS